MFQNESFFEILAHGGPVFYVILGISILAVFFIIERALAIGSVKSRMDKLFHKVIQRCKEERFDEAILLAKNHAGAEKAIVIAALERRGKSRESIEESLEREGARLQIFLEKRLSILATIGSTSPFIGLFGTVIGIIAAFQGISGSVSYAPAQVSNGIAEALVNTAAGLAVAIPSVLAYNAYRHRVDAIIANVEIFGSELVELLAGER